MRSDRGHLLLAGIVLAAAATTAHAGDRIVVESYVGERPSDAANLLGPVYAELGNRGYDYGTALSAEIERQVSRDGGALTTSQIVEAQRDLDDAYQHFIDGSYDVALRGAQKALAIYQTAPGPLARESALRDLEFKAYVVAAEASEAKGKGEDAFSLMAEVVRSFPDHAPSAADWDPKVVALYRRVRDELGRQGFGTLDVRVDDEAAVIFVDERFVGTGTAKIDKLLPGRYRVYIAKGSQPGRVHEIDVAPGAASTVNVSWEVDGVLRTSGDYVGLELPPGTTPENELAAAVHLGRAIGAKGVAVISVRLLNGRRAVVGYSISIESQNKTFGAVQAEPIAPTADTLAKLAALLAGDKSVSSAGLITEPNDTNAALDHGEGAPPPSSGLGGRRITAIVVGVAGLALAGGALAAESSSRSTYDQSKTEPDPQRQEDLFNSANNKHLLAQGLAVGGAACVVGAVVLWFTGRPHAGEHHVSVAPTPMSSGGAMVTMSLQF
jgi:hypothetical protein